MDIIQTVDTLSLTQPQEKQTEIKRATDSFGEMIGSMLDDLSRQEHAANQAIQQVHTGGEKNLHDAMISIEQADIALRYVIQVRNKALEAYQEISRLQL
ncbi:MAG: flagellar hook-basal body complex protein FliE [Desulfobulbus propionicus]|nr:MAG: flagellar hook-basal body complex protein FliE [Desulfobulbus propionicus]